jgi:hypothetical protein
MSDLIDDMPMGTAASVDMGSYFRLDQSESEFVVLLKSYSAHANWSFWLYQDSIVRRAWSP